MATFLPGILTSDQNLSILLVGLGWYAVALQTASVLMTATLLALSSTTSRPLAT